jgi:L-asparaginase
MREASNRVVAAIRIHVFTTGGTIDKIYFDAASEFQVGEPVVGGILEAHHVGVQFTLECLMRKDSLDIDDADRALIRERVAACDARYILITHGTDGMIATAKVLADIADKHIVLTGALQPAAFKGSDAEFNIGCALGALQCCPSGVYVAMNGRIFPHDNVAKNRSAHRFESIVDR